VVVADSLMEIVLDDYSLQRNVATNLKEDNLLEGK
jgi:hypothetical protein